LIKVGEQLIHAQEGNTRARKVTRAVGGALEKREREISRV